MIGKIVINSSNYSELARHSLSSLTSFNYKREKLRGGKVRVWGEGAAPALSPHFLLTFPPTLFPKHYYITKPATRRHIIGKLFAEGWRRVMTWWVFPSKIVAKNKRDIGVPYTIPATPDLPFLISAWTREHDWEPLLLFWLSSFLLLFSATHTHKSELSYFWSWWLHCLLILFPPSLFSWTQILQAFYVITLHLVCANPSPFLQNFIFFFLPVLDTNPRTDRTP